MRQPKGGRATWATSTICSIIFSGYSLGTLLESASASLLPVTALGREMPVARGRNRPNSCHRTTNQACAIQLIAAAKSVAGTDDGRYSIKSYTAKLISQHSDAVQRLCERKCAPWAMRTRENTTPSVIAAISAALALRGWVLRSAKNRANRAKPAAA